MSARDLINCSIVKQIQKIIINKKPKSLFDYYKTNKHRCAEVVPKVFPISKFSREVSLFKGLHLYNKLSTDLKELPPNKF